MSTTTQIRELDRRVEDAGQLEIALLWDPMASEAVGQSPLAVRVEDLRDDSIRWIFPPKDRALDAFYHPFVWLQGDGQEDRWRSHEAAGDPTDPRDER